MAVDSLVYSSDTQFREHKEPATGDTGSDLVALMANRASEDRIRQTLDQIYEAAIDPARWQDSVESIRSLFAGSRTCFAKFDPVTRAFEHVSTEPDPESVRQLKQFKRNVMLETACDAPLGEIYNDQAKIGRERLKRSAFWNDWARPRDMYGSLTTKIHVDASTFWFLDLQRGRNCEEFAAEDVELLGKLVPHILRAGRMSRNYQAQQSVGALFSSLPFGMFIVDRERNVLASNQVAETLLADSPGGLQLRSKQLRSVDPVEDARMAELVGKACTLKPDGLRHTGGDMFLAARGEERRSFALSVGPLNSTTMFGTSFQSCAAIFVKEVRMLLPESFAGYLQASFDLSPSEARLAAAIANGQSLKEVSAGTGIQLKTARTYLDRVFRKTNTHQQSQLVALLRGAVPYGMV